MVFESVVVDALNRILGSYVENLNKSQLKLGIWGGDVVLENLKLKQSALEELDIPVQTVYGNLGKLVLKIPWKNIYGESVEATIERLFLVINPNAEVKYDAVKEEKQAHVSKITELQRVEEAKKAAELKDQNKLDETFVEKLVTQIIKNVQLTIKDIHIRYEDTVTNPKAPFSCGITLHNLSVHTTDENWTKTVIQEAVTKIYKVLHLEGFAIYWNANTELYSKQESDNVKIRLGTEIATKHSIPESYKYVLGPINATAKLKLNRKPESDVPKFSQPKVNLTLHMNSLSVQITKEQYQDIMMLAESMDTMSKSAPYRKYRPDLKQYRGHYKEWWHFAYKCILEEEVLRRRRNWDWLHMLYHRTLCKKYATAYHNKLSCKGKVSGECQAVLDQGEKDLDLLNLVVVRRKIELEVERLGRQEEEKRQANRGWLSSWWYGNSGPENDDENEDLVKKFEKAMTSEEKEKLFLAIDYQENSSPLHLPAEYVSFDMEFILDELLVTLYDGNQKIMRGLIGNVEMNLQQRPSANALRVEVVMHDFTVLGVEQNGVEPQIVLSKDITKDIHLLQVTYETNPLDGKCDQRIKLSARPLQVIYDAKTVIDIVKTLKLPSESSALATLQEAAGNKLSDLKEKSALGLQHIVHQHHFIDIDLDIAASCIILPHGGKYTKGVSCIVVKLGAISVKTHPRSKNALDIHKMFQEGLCNEEIMNEIGQHLYDKMTLELSQMQVVVTNQGESWDEAIIAREHTSMHFLAPTNLIIDIHKCLITNDPSFPKIKVKGEWQNICMNPTEYRLLKLCEILILMPLPESDEPMPLKQASSKTSSLSLMKYLDPMEKEKREKLIAQSHKNQSDDLIQLTEVVAHFVLHELRITMHTQSESQPERVLEFSVRDLVLKAKQKTFTLNASVSIGSVDFFHYRTSFDPVKIISTPHIEGRDETDVLDETLDSVGVQETNAKNKYLFKITYLNVQKRCPEFRSKYGSIEQSIVMDFTKLKILLHQESLKRIMFLTNELQSRLDAFRSSTDRIANAGPLETIYEDSDTFAKKSKSSFKAHKPSQVESIQLKSMININAVHIEFANDKKSISHIEMTNMFGGFVLKSSYQQIDCTVGSIKVLDPNPESIHKEILKVLAGDVFKVRLIIFNVIQNEQTDINMSVDAEINCLQIVFLNWFVSSVMKFLNNFQMAQQAIIEASAQAADAARANVQTAYQNLTKVSMKIRLAAPIIIIPENSKSNNSVLVDFGQLTLDNVFKHMNIKELSNPVIVDEITLNLEKMKVSCVRYNENKISYERQLFMPTNFSLLCRRSLSTWYESLPDIEVTGRVKNIVITLGSSDYASIMRILNQNLKEGNMKVEEKTPITPLPSKQLMRTQTSKIASVRSNVITFETNVYQHRTSVKFAFAMDSFVINLMTNNEGENEVELATFCLALLSVKGKIMSDGSMNTSMLLVDCTLDDKRPGRGGRITRYLERRRKRTDSSSASSTKSDTMNEADKIRSMIDITYTMKNNDVFVDVRIFSFNLIIALDFLNRIFEFMSEDKDQENMPVAIKHNGAETKVKSSYASYQMTRVEDKTQSVMTVNLKIEQPDIILVESLLQRNCDAMVLNMEACFRMRQSDGVMVVDGGVSKVRVVIKNLGSSSNAVRHFLSPTDVSIVMNKPENSGMHLDVVFTDVVVTVSPDALSLLNRVIATMTQAENETGEKEVKPITYEEGLWLMKPFSLEKYWFLRTEEAEEAINYTPVIEDPLVQKITELCIISCPSILISFEIDIGNDTIPILVLQASLNAQVKDWSTEFHLESICAMQVSYYNINRAVWEPLIEPIEKFKEYKFFHEPWELKVEVIMRSVERDVIDTTDEATNLQMVANRLASKSILISCCDTLEITITRTGLEVLTNLSNSFSSAMGESTEGSMVAKPSFTVKKRKSHKHGGAQYIFHNETGVELKLLLQDNKDFVVYRENALTHEYKEVLLESGASVPLKLKSSGLTFVRLNKPPLPLTLTIDIPSLNREIELPVERAVKRFFPLDRPESAISATRLSSFSCESQGIISEVVMKDAAMNIYIRSIVQVINNLTENVSVFYMKENGEEIALLGEVQAGEILRLPLDAVYTPSAELFFSISGFSVSDTAFVWRDLQNQVKTTQLLQCQNKSSEEKFYIKAVGSMEQVYYGKTSRHKLNSACYEIVLQPVVKMQNCLPFPIVISQHGLQRTQLFEAGEMYHLSHLAPNNALIVIMIKNYLDKCWVCTQNLPEAGEELSVWSFVSHDSPTVMTLDLGMHNADFDGTQVLSLYCPFWMLNKTGLTLSYRNAEESNNVIFHASHYKEPILFSFRAKDFFGKKKASIRVDFGEWSDKFPLDVPGSSGKISCMTDGKLYQVAVTNTLTFNSLTKMVLFTPFYQIINDAPFDIEYQEHHRPGDPWVKVDKKSSGPLWPKIDKEDKLMVLRVAGTSHITSAFMYTEQNTSCLKLENEYGGLHVEVQTNEGGTCITIRQYHDGHAPALLINHSSYNFNIYEKEHVSVKKMQAMNELMFAWSNPAGPRIIIFEAVKRKEIENDLRKDGFGEFVVSDSQSISWVSFLDGLQRVILFTDDPILASGVHTFGEADIVDTEIVVEMHGMGVSLVDDLQHQEIIYASISNSGVLWEQCKVGARRYKKIEEDKMLLIEEAYQRYLNEKQVSDVPISPKVVVDGKYEMDFNEMLMLRPYERLVRRVHSPGLWVGISHSLHSTSTHARLHRLQIDQQLPYTTFPVVLAPVPPPKTIIQTHGMKPFMEISIVEHLREHTSVRQYKYYKFLVQEFHIKVDMGLVNALYNMFPSMPMTEQEALEAFNTDYVTALKPLLEILAQEAAAEQKNFYDIIHLSPLKVHVSFSFGNASSLPSFIGTLLQSIGVTLTDMNDVVFKLSYYERNYEFMSQRELIEQAKSHYTGQALKQLYVLVLGLDVIGNPYGLVIGLKKGVEDLFYEPFHGFIQGPGEFAEGLYLGVRSLVGHTVGGAAGAVSRITGAMGHGLAALSLDKDYQKRRRDNINKPPANLHEGLARSGKGLVMGFVDGVTGVFTKPIEGAQEQGVEGFFKGLGLGAVGLVTRPTAGMVDFASGSFDAVKRAADLSEELRRRRPARFLQKDAGVVPYSRRYAEGNRMLRELEKGKYLATDSYEAHVWVAVMKEMVLCTDKRILYLERNNVFGIWKVIWTYQWEEIPDLPSIVTKGIFIPTLPKKKMFGMIPGTGAGKLILLNDEHKKKFLFRIIAKKYSEG